MDVYKDFLRILDKALLKYGSANKLAKALDVAPNKITRWKNGERVPTLTSIQTLLDITGSRLCMGDDEVSRDVCFVDARVVGVEKNVESPRAEDYVAAPLVGEVGAGPGHLPEDVIKSWFLVSRNLPAVRYRKNLIAVEIARGSTSMLPTLNPGDIVLVDRDDRDVTNPGHIMLVMDPLDNSGMIKRVAVRTNGDDFLITYYSDNTASYPPILYSLNNDFEGDWDRAIAGRVIWAWQDIRDK